MVCFLGIIRFKQGEKFTKKDPLSPTRFPDNIHFQFTLFWHGGVIITKIKFYFFRGATTLKVVSAENQSAVVFMVT